MPQIPRQRGAAVARSSQSNGKISHIRNGRSGQHTNDIKNTKIKPKYNGYCLALRIKSKYRLKVLLSLVAALGLLSVLPRAYNTTRQLRVENKVAPRIVRLLIDSSVRRQDLSEITVSAEPNTSYNRTIHDRLQDVRPKKSSRDYRHEAADDIEEGDCRAQYDWQKRSFPSCNSIHEIDLSHMFLPRTNVSSIALVSNGYWRDVWVFGEPLTWETYVLKTQRYEHDYSKRNFDRHRRDAVAMERLTFSPYILNIYAFCGDTGISEYGEEGDIDAAILENDNRGNNLTSLQKLHIATQAALGLSDVHNCDKPGRASIAHTDMGGSQYIKIGDVYKLNDFNRARFIAWNQVKDEACKFEVGSNPGKGRSPEEYAYLPEDEKVDVYSLGNIYYTLLQGEDVFEGIKTKIAQDMVMNGTRPSFYPEVWNSTDPSDMAIKQAMIMCHQQDPAIRASSKQVADFLTEQLEKIDPGRRATWEN